MDNLPIALADINPFLLEEIGQQVPQLKTVLDVNIDDVKKYGYEYAWKKEDGVEKIINGKKYIVKGNYIEELLELVKLYECQTLSVSSSTLIKIYNCYLRICDDRAMFDEMYKKHSFFSYSYDCHMNNKKVFLAMDRKNSIVATMLFHLYHYNLKQSTLIGWGMYIISKR